MTARKLQVGEQLSLVNRRQVINSLDFYDHNSLDEEVQAVATIQSYFPIDHRQWFLLFYLQATFDELECETRFICGLEEAGPKSAMHLNSSADDALRDPVQCFGLCQLCALRVLSGK